MARVLSDEGWATSAVGKWHLTPRDHRTPAGPFTHWPIGLGFDRFYGIIGGEDSQWTPDLIRDNSYTEPPRTPDQGYHFTEDMADEAISVFRGVKLHQPDRPVFMWFATGAPHSPHHVDAEWIDAYHGDFDHGWDVERERTLERQKELGIVAEDVELSPRPEWIPAWDDLDDDQRRLFARMQEVFAAFVEHTDAQIGRILDQLEELGELDNTIVAMVSDNGASGEGGPHGSFNWMRSLNDLPEPLEYLLDHYDHLGGHHSYGHYPWAWAHAGNTPFRRWKRYTLEGGVRDPFLLSWPAGIDSAGGLRDQYCHAIDVMPTILDLLEVDVPTAVAGAEQLSVDGHSLSDVVDDPNAPSARTTQYYECWGSRAIYHQGWKAVTNHINQLHPARADHHPGEPALRGGPLGSVRHHRRSHRVGGSGRQPTRPLGRTGGSVAHRGRTQSRLSPRRQPGHADRLPPSAVLGDSQ